MTAFTIPTLETDRLILRAFAPGDFDLFAEFYASDRSAFVGGPYNRERAWRVFAAEAGHWLLQGFGRWALEEKATKRFIGVAGLWYPEGFPERELGWDLMDVSALGKGYATEAGAAARNFAYANLGWTTLVSMILPENAASRRVADRLGCQKDGTFTHPVFGTNELWRHPSPEALS